MRNKRDEYWQGVLDEERKYWQEIVRDLTNRIQAPQVAVAQSLPEPDGPVYVSSSNDEALAEYEENHNQAVWKPVVVPD